MGAIRLLPIVLFATVSLFGLKAMGLLSGHGYLLGGLQDARAQDAQPAKRSWAQEMFGYPDVTGSVAGNKSPPPAAVPPDRAPPPVPPARAPTAAGMPAAGTPIPLDDRPAIPAGERAVLERLQERRQELDARAGEIEVREGLLKAAEKRLEARIAELKALEAQVNAAMQKKDETEAARFKGLITMYEGMKPKEAARIFDRLEPKVLLEVAGQISPRRMAEILAQMSPEAAERLTVELAARPNAKGASLHELPKIEGRPRN